MSPLIVVRTRPLTQVKRSILFPEKAAHFFVQIVGPIPYLPPPFPMEVREERASMFQDFTFVLCAICSCKPKLGNDIAPTRQATAAAADT